jgi:hypothetical protein
VPGTIVAEAEPESSVLFRHNATTTTTETSHHNNQQTEQIKPTNQTNNNNSPTESSANPYVPENNLFNRLAKINQKLAERSEAKSAKRSFASYDGFFFSFFWREASLLASLRSAISSENAKTNFLVNFVNPFAESDKLVFQFNFAKIAERQKNKIVLFFAYG